jgi:hypothetical protein
LGKKGQGMRDGHCHCCCCKHHDEGGDGIGALLALLLAGLGLMAYVANWLGLMVANALSVAASVVGEYQTELLCISLGAILIDLCFLTRRIAGDVAKVPLKTLGATLRSRLPAFAPGIFTRARLQQVAKRLGGQEAAHHKRARRSRARAIS